jgi:hypothetical protein
LKGSAKLTPEPHGRFKLTDGVAELINPQTNAELSAYMQGSTHHDNATGLEIITLKGRKVLIGSTERLLIGSPPFRVYPEGTFSATGRYNPDTADLKITFKFQVTKA